MAFCSQFHLRPLSLQEITLCRFVAYLSSLSLGYQTIRCYLSALCHLQISAGFPDTSLPLFLRLSYMLKGVHRAHHHPCRPPRLSITPDLLHKMHHTWSQRDIDYDKLMLWAAFCRGFFGFHQSGKFTSTAADPTSPDKLLPADIEVDSHINPGCMTVHLGRSKTDQFRAGATVYLGSTRDALCPVTAMMAYLALRPPPTPGLSRDQLITQLRQARPV